MFKLNIVNDNIASAIMATSKLNDSILWRARLGHVHFKRMQDMSKNGLILAFDMDTEKCKTCMLNKITKKNQFNKSKNTETEVLELIHSDLCDLHATPSLGNKKYFVTFIDDTSRTDRGGEYMDTLYFHYAGIIHEMTAPYTSQQNGISERKNRVLKEMVNPMLSYSGLSQRAVVRLPDPKLKTLGERGIECIFDGYAEHSKGFYLIEPNKSVLINSIIESMDAIFDENRFSSVPKPSLMILNRTEDIGVVLSIGYLLNQADKYVYIKFDESGKGVIIFLYVDDMLIFGTNQVQVDQTKEFLSSKFSMKDMVEADVILGIRIKHESNGIAISQFHYIEK
ncbi:zinc finger, CCHC-type containing protein, partial [Tanacetum coccineum]